jgi:hypothetical protein
METDQAASRRRLDDLFQSMLLPSTPSFGHAKSLGAN